MKEMPLLGRVYTISDSREKYIYYLNKYSGLAEDYSKSFEDGYIRYFHDMDSLIDAVLEYGNTVIREVIETECIAELVANGFYSYDFERFFDEYYAEKYYVYEDYYNIVADKYAKIVFTQEQEHQYRELRKETRGRWAGGGFGVKGAVKGAAKAGAMNMATGAAHSIFNAVGNYMTDSETNRKKRELFHDNETKDTLVTGIYNSIFNLAYAVMDFFNENSDTKTEGVNDDQKKEADIILGNLSKFSVPDETKTDLIYRILYLNPFNEGVYSFVLNYAGDKNLELENLAKLFGIDLRRRKKDILEEIFKSIDMESSKALATGRKRIEEQAAYIGADAAPFVKQIEAALKKVLQKEEILRQIADVNKKIAEQFQTVAPVKKKTDKICNACVDEGSNADAIEDILNEIDGKIAYAEWAAIDVFNSLVIKCVDDVKADRQSFENGFDAIEELLKVYDKGINSCMEKDPRSEQKNVALNVLRAAVHIVAIRGEHSIYGIDIGKSGTTDAARYGKWKKCYKEEQEHEDMSLLKKCAEIIFEGAERENALACVLQLHFFGSNIWTEKEKKLCRIAAEKYYPDAACQIGAMVLSEAKSIQGTLEGAYWLMMADKLGVSMGIDLSENTLIEMCMPYVKTFYEEPVEKKTIDKAKEIMYVEKIFSVPNRGIGIVGTIRCGKISYDSKVTLFDRAGNYKGDSRILGIEKDKNIEKIVYMGDHVSMLLENFSFKVQTGDILCLY